METYVECPNCKKVFPLEKFEPHLVDHVHELKCPECGHISNEFESRII